MKLKDLIYRAKRTKEFQEEIYVSEFAEKEFEIYDINHWDSQSRLISYFIADWYCTDTRVGYRVYFFDDKPVAFSSQLGRKMKEALEWLSQEDYKNVRDYVMSFADNKTLTIADINENIDETYKVEFYSQMFDHHKKNAIYNDRKVEVVNFRDSFNDGKYHPETVEIQFENGEKQWVKTSNLDFNFNIETP